jgi:hypothetical protein
MKERGGRNKEKEWEGEGEEGGREGGWREEEGVGGRGRGGGRREEGTRLTSSRKKESDTQSDVMLQIQGKIFTIPPPFLHPLPSPFILFALPLLPSLPSLPSLSSPPFPPYSRDPASMKDVEFLSFICNPELEDDNCLMNWTQAALEVRNQ